MEGTPFDFRRPKPIGQDIDADYECLNLQGGYDHNFEVRTNPCAILATPDHSRSMLVFTDTPGIHTPKTRLGEEMMSAANGAVADCDLTVLVPIASNFCTSSL